MERTHKMSPGVTAVDAHGIEDDGHPDLQLLLLVNIATVGFATSNGGQTADTLAHCYCTIMNRQRVGGIITFSAFSWNDVDARLEREEETKEDQN